ncbi:MAG: hypothetical protein K1060chlam1_00519 [Candidatus Anoxychlamydiales bacterium]|nr:hypothetical protein [Candidatus Anoxychlamydiales bacterium]
MSLIKKISWILPAIALTSGAFADNSDISSYCDPCPPKEPSECDPCYEKSRNKPYEQGYEICEGALPKAYNAPGRIDICEGIDAYVTGSFIYWEIFGDQLDLGSARTDTDTPITVKAIKFTTEYEPGFKIGLGSHFSHDDWHLYAQYTRLHANESTTWKPTVGATGVFITPFFLNDTSNSHSFNFTDIPNGVTSKWKMELDKIDLELGRAFYVGTNLITTPFVGLSGHWMDQSYSMSLTDGRTSGGGVFSGLIKNDSWAIGPRFGFESKWIFYEGFRLFGYGAFALMFSENDMSGNTVESDTAYTASKVEELIVRDVEELAIGLAWGSYFTSDKWHMDLSVAYELQRYSHTNYMSYYSQLALSGTEVKPGDTFMHGLTLSARFDF